MEVTPVKRQVPSKDDDKLSGSTTTKKRPYTPRKSQNKVELSVSELMGEFPEELRQHKLAKATVSVLKKMYQTKTINLMEEIKMVGFVLNEPEEDASPGYPTINQGDYMFSKSNDSRTYGLTKKDIEKTKYGVRSLHRALSAEPKMHEHSLDFVFRNALKELSNEFYDGYEDDGYLTIDNPILITGRYLELNLMNKIRNYYIERQKGDIFQVLSDSCPENTDLEDLIQGCNCEMYIRRLRDVYGLTPGTTVMKEPVLSVQQMRVWTNTDIQLDTNMMLMNYMADTLKSVQQEDNNKRDGRESNREANPANNNMSVDVMRLFISAFVKNMKKFVKKNQRLLQMILKQSELFAWMTLGLTSDDESCFSNTAYWYAKTKDHDFDQLHAYPVCWNYPLRSLFKTVENSDISTPNKYLNDLDDFISKMWKSDCFN